jgi:hypothetical protein
MLQGEAGKDIGEAGLGKWKKISKDETSDKDPERVL